MNNRATYNKRRNKAESASGFSRRIAERRLKWWTIPYHPTHWRYYLKKYDLLKMQFTRFRRDDPEERWLGCDSWQRLLLNKWNSREFVQRYDVPVPELYWTGRFTAKIPLAQLPGRLAIRPAWGAGKRGVHVIADGHKLLGAGSPDAKSLLRQLKNERGFFSLNPLLCEEAILLRTGGLRLPMEFKCYMFGGFVGAVQVLDRGKSGQELTTRYYGPDWLSFKHRMCQGLTQMPVQKPPPYLDSMLNWARLLGAACETFMRVDFFGTEDRCVFNEFSSTPGTRNNSPFLDEFFESLWKRHIPDQEIN